MWLRKRCAIGTWSLLLLVLISCDPGPPREAIGVTKSGSRIVVYYVLCPGELVKDLQLLTARGGIIGDEDDQVLWDVSSDEGSRQSSYTVGAKPEGFSETSSLRLLPSPRQRLAVVVQTTRADNFVVLRLSDLREDRIWVADQNTNLVSFQTRALERCS
jgi:hypothetical protein